MVYTTVCMGVAIAKSTPVEGDPNSSIGSDVSKLEAPFPLLVPLLS